MSRAYLDAHTREQLAKAIRDDYVAREAGNQDAGADAEHLVPYEQLSETERESERVKADDIASKLEIIGAVIVPLERQTTQEFELTPSELERLSRHEHVRWMREKLEAGWRRGPTLDPIALTHPCLVRYNRLPEDEKEKDRQVVERIPLLLESAGLGVARRVTGQAYP